MENFFPIGGFCVFNWIQPSGCSIIGRPILKMAHRKERIAHRLHPTSSNFYTDRSSFKSQLAHFGFTSFKLGGGISLITKDCKSSPTFSHFILFYLSYTFTVSNRTPTFALGFFFIWFCFFISLFSFVIFKPLLFFFISIGR